MYVDRTGLDFGLVQLSHTAALVRRGIFMSALHFFGQPQDLVPSGATGSRIIATLASLYWPLGQVVLRRSILASTRITGSHNEKRKNKVANGGR